MIRPAVRSTNAMGKAALVLFAIISLLLTTLAIAGPALATHDPKVFVCKFTGTPGVNEVLQTGDNPTNPNANSIPAYKAGTITDETLVGASFSDEQGRSVVIAIGTDEEGLGPDPCLGKIVVDKVVTGTGASVTEDFAISVTGQAAFMLSAEDAKKLFAFVTQLGATYTVGETLTAAQIAAGWKLTGIVCTSSYGRALTGATFTVGVGETITCTVTNDFAPGSITIVKEAHPEGAQDFAFTTTGTGLSSFSLDDDADATLSNQKAFTGLGAGSYSVSEGATAGWELTQVHCTAVAGTTTAATASGVNIQLGPRAHVTCWFVNTKLGTPVTPCTCPVVTPQAPKLPNTAVPMELAGSLGGLLVLLSGIGFSVNRRRNP